MAPALILLLFLTWLLAVGFLRYYRIWLLYYIVSAVGCAYWFILLFGTVLGLDSFLAHTVAWTVHYLSNLISIPTRIFEGSPGLLLVMVIAQKIGWTALQVGVESSGLLEIGVMTSLLLFYPGWTIYRRSGMILLGGFAIWLANIIRMMVIVVMLNRFGKEALVLAHMYVGKAVFFLLAVGIFWFLITAVTLKDLEKGRLQVQTPA
jgi:exosortase family protein XrtG